MQPSTRRGEHSQAWRALHEGLTSSDADELERLCARYDVDRNNEVDAEEFGKMKGSAGGGQAYDSDDEDGRGGGQRVQCAQQ